MKTFPIEVVAVHVRDWLVFVKVDEFNDCSSASLN